MVTQMEAPGKWFEQVCESFRKASQDGLRLQQDLFKQLASEWPKLSEKNSGSTEQMKSVTKEVREKLRNMLDRHRTAMNADFEACIQALDESFQLSDVKDVEQYREQLQELFRKNFETMKQMAEVNVQEYKTTVEEFMELAKPASK